MNASTFQLKIILHSYQNNLNLVYNTADQSFYPVTNAKRLDKKIYLTDKNEVANKIKKFISDNIILLNRQVVKDFQTYLKKRVAKIETHNKGIEGFFRWIVSLLNPFDRETIQKKIKDLEALITAIKDAEELVKNKKRDFSPPSLEMNDEYYENHEEDVLKDREEDSTKFNTPKAKRELFPNPFQEKESRSFSDKVTSELFESTNFPKLVKKTSKTS